MQGYYLWLTGRGLLRRLSENTADVAQTEAIFSPPVQRQVRCQIRNRPARRHRNPNGNYRTCSSWRTLRGRKCRHFIGPLPPPTSNLVADTNLHTTMH